jgi:serine/threonine-protein kinase HipA
MRKADVYVNGIKAGVLTEVQNLYKYEFSYVANYSGHPISLTLPVKTQVYSFNSFPSVFEGLLPEGVQLEALLRDKKINRNDYFSQLMVCGGDCVGAVTVKEVL